MAKQKKQKSVETLTHDEAKRRNIPTAEFQSALSDDEKSAIRLAYERRNRDLDPQLVWRGKDEQDWSDLVVDAPPLYIQEKVHPKVLIDDLMRRSKEREMAEEPEQFDLFSDFNGLPEHAKTAEFYQHDANWTNRMILGDSLQVMASLAEREGLRGKVQTIYIDPPYGIKFNSNFQWSTTSRTVTDGKWDHITREPEQVKAFRDTWRDGIHSYLTYLRDRLTVARDLLSDTGSVFVQIGEENVHRVRALLDEVFGETGFCSLIAFETTTGQTSSLLAQNNDFILWYAKKRSCVKFRQLHWDKKPGDEGGTGYRHVRHLDGRIEAYDSLKHSHKSVVMKGDATSQRQGRPSGVGSAMHFPIECKGHRFEPRGGRGWSTTRVGMDRLNRAGRLIPNGINLAYLRFLRDSPSIPHGAAWRDTGSGFLSDKVYVVQTNPKVVERCILMSSDPGDLVLDPTCGSGTTAHTAEQWGRRWITIDTSRVALALARSRLMGARYSYYLLADSPEGREKEAEVTGTVPPRSSTHGDVRQGFVYERVPHITLKSIANNIEIDVIWDEKQPPVEKALSELNAALRGHNTPFQVTEGGRSGQKIDFTAANDKTVELPSGEQASANSFLEWEVPRESPSDWPEQARKALDAFWKARIERQKAIDASIERNAEQEYLYDRPYEDKSRVRVAGPFTVESLSPHRVIAVGEDNELLDEAAERAPAYGERSEEEPDFATVVIENLKRSGVQQAHKQDKIVFSSITGWPGEFIAAEGRYTEGESEAERRAGIFIGPEFGTVSKPDLVAAAREAADAGFDVLIACAFNYDAQSSEFNKLGKIPVLKARMNADLHMADELANTGSGNLFVIFGEPDIEIQEAHSDGQDRELIQVKINGVDVFHPQSGQVDSSGPEGIAIWFIDTDYNEESFFIRQAYFLGTGDPYKSLKTTLKDEIDREAWESLYSDTSRPFPKPASGRIAVKVINHLGDEVMKVFRVT